MYCFIAINQIQFYMTLSSSHELFLSIKSLNTETMASTSSPPPAAATPLVSASQAFSDAASASTSFSHYFQKA